MPAGEIWQPLSGGRTNRLWRTADLVVKLYCPAAATPLFPNDPDAEVAALAALSGTGIAPMLAGRIEAAQGTCIVYRHVPGRAGAVDPGDAGRLLARLHGVTPPKGLRRRPGGAAALVAEAEAMQNALPEPMRTRLARIRPDGGPGPTETAVFLHGDPVPANIVAKPEGACLIDWQCPAEGDAAEDLALFLSPAMQMLYGRGPLDPAAESAFLSGYGDASRVGRYRALAPVFHWRMAAYCLWRAQRGDHDYAAAAEAELAPLGA